MAHIKQSETTYMFIFSKVSSVNYMLLVTVPVINNLICAEETTKLFCIQSISFDYGILCIGVTIFNRLQEILPDTIMSDTIVTNDSQWPTK